jgi:hypothetical protein
LYENCHNRNKKDLPKLIWKKNTGSFVQPVEVIVSEADALTIDKIHFVPLLENLCAILNNKEIKIEYFKQKKTEPDKILSFNDTTKFKNSEFFTQNKDAIQLKLFMDAYSDNNALQDAKNKDKIHGMYFKLNNLDEKLLSKDYVTQLILLIDDTLTKKYTFKVLLNCLIKDLITLEQVGIQVDDKAIRGTIIYIVADSLGANQIMGLVMSFNTNTNCKVT